MNLTRGLILGACLLALAGCSSNPRSFSEVKALNETKAVGSPFTQALAAEYRVFVNDDLSKEHDYPNALHFARKGIAAANGDTVLPEPVSDWNLLPEDVQALSAARGRLLAAFDRGARELSPKETAVAQVRYDCWIEQQEDDWYSKQNHSCKSEFESSLGHLESTLPAAAMPPAEAAAPPADTGPNANAPMKNEDAMYLIFFDFDKTDITPGGRNILDSVVAEAKNRNLKAIHVVGHTDTSGPHSYNDRLSVHRANAVRDYLVGHGIEASIIDVQGHGEDDLLVKTPDGVREPANRRAQITFE